MATYGGTQRGTPRIELDADGNQQVVYDDIEVSPNTRHESWTTNPYVLAAIGMGALPAVAALPALGGVGGSTAASVAAPTAAATPGGGGLLGGVVGGLLGGGSTADKVLAGGRILGGMVGASAKNRENQTRDELLASQINQQGARDAENALMDRAKFARESSQLSERDRAMNYDRVMRAQRRLDFQPMQWDTSGMKTLGGRTIPALSGGRFSAPNDAERELLEGIRAQALRDAMNPNKTELPAYAPAPRAQVRGSGLFEKIGGPIALGANILGRLRPRADDEDVTVGDAVLPSSSNA